MSFAKSRNSDRWSGKLRMVQSRRLGYDIPVPSFPAKSFATLFTPLKIDNCRAEVLKMCGNIIMHLEGAKIWPAWIFF
jgi:hypothetical protein